MFSKRNQYLIDPFVRPSICCLIIAVIFLFAGGVGIKLYQFYLVSVLVWLVKLTSIQLEDVILIVSILSIVVSLVLIIVGVLWYRHSRNTVKK